MEITAEYLNGLKANYVQQKNQMIANTSALDGAIQNIDVILAKLSETPPDPT